MVAPGTTDFPEPGVSDLVTVKFGPGGGEDVDGGVVDTETVVEAIADDVVNVPVCVPVDG